MSTIPSIADADRLVSYTPASLEDEFAVTWPVIGDTEEACKDDLVVVVNGATLADADYTFTGTAISGVSGIWNGGTVTLDAAVQNVAVVIYSSRAPRRTSNFLEGKTLPFTTLDKLLDEQTIQQRDLFTRLKTTIRGPAHEGAVSQLPAKASRAGKILAWDASGDPSSFSYPADTVAYLLSVVSALSADNSALTQEAIAAMMVVAGGIVTPQMFGAEGDGVADDATAFQAMLDSGTAGKVHTIVLPRGTYRLTAGLTWPTLYRVVMIGFDPESVVLQFEHEDGEPCITIPTLGGDQYIPVMRGFKIEGNALSGDGIHCDHCGVGPWLDDIKIDGCSKTGAAALRFTNTYIGVIDRCRLFHNYDNMVFEYAAGFNGRGNWISGAAHDEIRFDSLSRGNTIQIIELGQGTSDTSNARTAVRYQGDTNRVDVDFYENYKNYRAIVFEAGSYNNTFAVRYGAPINVYDAGIGNQYPVSDVSTRENALSEGWSLAGPWLSSGASIENQYPDGWLFASGASAHFSPQSPNPVSISVSSAVGALGDTSSIKIDMPELVDPGQWIGAKTFTLQEDDVVRVRMMVRASRDLEADEAIVFKIEDSSTYANLGVRYVPDLRTDQWTPIEIHYRADSARTIVLGGAIFRTSTTTALSIYVDCITLAVNKSVVPLMRNDTSASTVSEDETIGLRAEVMRINRPSFGYGSSKAGAVALAESDGAIAVLNVGATEEILKQYTVPAYALAKDGETIELDVYFKCAANANNKRVQVRLGGTVDTVDGTVIADTGVAAANDKLGRLRVLIQRTAANAASCFADGQHNATSLTLALVSASITASAATYIKVTGTGAAGNDIELKSCVLRLGKKPA